jgi:hypothetical protein
MGGGADSWLSLLVLPLELVPLEAPRERCRGVDCANATSEVESPCLPEEDDVEVEVEGSGHEGSRSGTVTGVPNTAVTAPALLSLRMLGCERALSGVTTSACGLISARTRSQSSGMADAAMPT